MVDQPSREAREAGWLHGAIVRVTWDGGNGPHEYMLLRHDERWCVSTPTLDPIGPADQVEVVARALDAFAAKAREERDEARQRALEEAAKFCASEADKESRLMENTGDKVGDIAAMHAYGRCSDGIRALASPQEGGGHNDERCGWCGIGVCPVCGEEVGRVL